MNRRNVCMLMGTLLVCTLAVNLQAQTKGKTRTYYVAADELEWDYAPSGIDEVTGKPFEGYAKAFVETGPHRIGKVYRKAIYREYMDATFKQLKPRPAAWEHLGIMGPALQAEVGDTIKIVFRNNGTHPYSMHPHGVFYAKASEGALYHDGVEMKDKPGAAVPSGGTHTYVWEVPERAGPGPNDGSSVLWFYHSHVDEPKDVNSGLIGPLIVTARGKARPDGSPKDVDREFVALFMIFDENQSWYLDANIKKYVSDPAKLDRGEFIPLDPDGNGQILLGTGFSAMNHKYAINGFLFGNLPMMTMKKGERVRWYLFSLGDGFNFHTPHWHGNVVMADGKRTDVLALSPAQMLVADMVPDNPGTWMFHCHVSDHLVGGMHVHYRVE